MRKVIKKVNIPKWICYHLVGENHKTHHRLICGTLVMIVGVIISKAGGETYIIHYVCDTAGYAIHGIGLVPWIDEIIKRKGV